jgi:molecular chaperone HtpG
VGRGQLDLGDIDEADEEDIDKLNESNKELIDRISGVLEGDVQEVRATNRLTESPACLVIDEYDMGKQMRKVMEASGQKLPDSPPIFEINPSHALVGKLEAESNDERFADLTRVLFDQAALAEGQQPKDPGLFVQRLNKLLIDLSS